MTKIQRAYLELHIAVLLFGFTAILGNLIQLSAIVLVWWRVLLACGVFIAFGKIFSKIRLLPKKLIWQYIAIGGLVALHWLAFYAAIKLSNASVALICLATTSFLSAILEPLMTRQPIKKHEIALGIVIIPAMIFVAGSLPSSMTAGLVVGLMSAVFVVVFSILNKKLITRADPLSISLLELGGALVFLTLLLPFFFKIEPTAAFLPSPTDWIYLLVLAVLCTNVAYLLATRTLRHLSAFATNLTINLEPVYGIMLAVVILKENKQLSAAFYIGAAVILAAVLSYPFLDSRFGKKQ